MMTWMARITILIVLLTTSHTAQADESGPDIPGEARPQLDPDETHPIYAGNYSWINSLLIGSAGLFIAALVIGPIVRTEAPDAVPPAISHEEDPAVDQH